MNNQNHQKQLKSIVQLTLQVYDVILPLHKLKIKMESADNLVREPFNDPVDIAFKSIRYAVQVKAKERLGRPGESAYEEKVILDNLSGIFKGGQLTAIMGSSGAGKTTLLNIIAGRITNFTGELYANNKPYNFDNFGDFANYVMQSDLLMQTLTVRETLQFAAKLKITDVGRIEEKIMLWTKKLKLEKCLDVIVGGNMLKGISGGQKKRTSIAFELMSDPKVIALDEPTSGMDSLTSYIIINELKTLAKAGKTVFLTIHQPNSDIFELFDKLLLMVDGRIIYQGRNENTQEYFEKQFNLPCPTYMNPADHFISIIHHEDEQNVERYPQYFKAYAATMQNTVLEDIENRQKGAIQVRKIETSSFNTLKVLLKRDALNTFRNPLLAKARIFQIIFMAIFTGGLYFNVGNKDYTDPISWNTITGYLFFIGVDLVTQSMTPVALVFPSERVVFLKEQNSKMYGVLSYFLSRNIVQIPFLFVIPAFYILIVYWMLSLGNTAGQFFITYFIMFLLSYVGSSLGLLIGSMLKDQKGMNLAIPVFVLPLIVLAGFFKNPENMSAWYSWIQYISPFKYGFSSLIRNEVTNRSSLIDTLNLDFDMWPSILMLLALGTAMRVLSCFLLWFKKSRLQ